MTGGDRSDATGGAGQLMTLTTTDVASAVVVSVAGELDLHTAPDLMSALDRALERPGLTVAVVDLSEVRFLGSSGLGVLANLAGRPGVTLRLVAPETHRTITRPWRAMSLQQLLPLYASIGDALDDRSPIDG